MLDTFNLGTEIITATQDVFSTMLMVDLESDVVVENSKCDIQSNLTSMIGLGGDSGTLSRSLPCFGSKSYYQRISRYGYR